MGKNVIIKAFQFEDFIISIIRQKCLSQGKPFVAEYRELIESNNNKYLSEYRNYFVHSSYRFDGFAPDGFDDLKAPVVVEIKYNPRNMVFEDLVPENENFISLYIVSSEMSEKELAKRIKGRNVIVWGRETIKTWEKQFPIDYYSFYPIDLEKEKDVDNFINFETKNRNNMDLLLKDIHDRKISISLGAGVSIEYGSRKWDDLINDFYVEIQRNGKIDDVQAVQKKIGGTSVINGQFAQENLKDFMSSLYNGLYLSYTPPISKYNSTTLHYIADLIVELKDNRRFNVITYNYDNFLEQELNNRNELFNTLFCDTCLIDEKLSIYHPHGFLPYGISPAQYNNYKDYIVFSESEYHKLYNNPLSWAMVTQQFLYRESAYLFIGCSLSDPNIRRILEITKVKGRIHYALMLTDSLSKKDQFIVHRHFVRIGVECIWVNTVNDLKKEIQRLSI